jgi:hypothetical protein
VKRNALYDGITDEKFMLECPIMEIASAASILVDLGAQGLLDLVYPHDLTDRAREFCERYARELERLYPERVAAARAEAEEEVQFRRLASAFERERDTARYDD